LFIITHKNRRHFHTYFATINQPKITFDCQLCCPLFPSSTVFQLCATCQLFISTLSRVFTMPWYTVILFGASSGFLGMSLKLTNVLAFSCGCCFLGFASIPNWSQFKMGQFQTGHSSKWVAINESWWRVFKASALVQFRSPLCTVNYQCPVPFPQNDVFLQVP